MGQLHNILGFLYAGSFDYTSSLANLAADGRNTFSFNLTAGTDYYMVVT